MAENAARDFRLTVLNPGGRDREQHFGDGAGEPGIGHQPTNFHGYAACTRGFFDRDVKQAIARDTPVLLLLRGDFRHSQAALHKLKSAGITVAISLKETGLHQIADQLRDPAKLARFVDIVRAADACIGATPEVAELYRQLRGDDSRVAFIPTPYPIEDPRWDFARQLAERGGVLIGTREFDVTSRNHLAALMLARNLAEHTQCVTVFNYDGRRGAKLLRSLRFPAGKLRPVERRVSYPEWLQVVSQHRLVLQLDRSRVPGQVAGDALLCRTVCVGGDGAIDRLVFPHTCGFGRSLKEIAELGQRLLQDDRCYAQASNHATANAVRTVSFNVVRDELEQFFRSL